MIEPSAAKAQAQTLRDWAAAYDAEEAEGAAEVAFLLRRAATMIEAVVSETVTFDRTERLPASPLLDEVREG